MRRPTLAGQIRIAQLYNRMGVTSEQMWDFDKEQQMKFLAEHGYEISRMVAVTLCRGWWAQRLWERPMAWLVRQKMPHDYMLAAMMRFVTLYGHGPFFTYYQIGRADESDEAETEPGRDRELKSRYEGPIALSICMADSRCHWMVGKIHPVWCELSDADNDVE